MFRWRKLETAVQMTEEAGDSSSDDGGSWSQQFR